MRRVSRRWALLAACAPMIVFACSTFEEAPGDDGGAEGGAETGIETSSPVDASTETAVDAGPGCPKGACGTVIAQGENNASEIATDGTRIFWTIDQVNGAVRTIDPSTGKPKTISGPEDRPRAPVVYSDVVYYGTSTSVHVIGKDGDADGGTNAKVASSTTNAGANIIVTSIQRVGAQLLFTGSNKLFRCPTSPDGCGGNAPAAESFPGSGTSSVTVSTNGRVWFSDQIELLEVVFSPYDAIIRFNQTDVRAVVADETRLYFLRSGDKRVLSLATDGNISDVPQELATSEFPPYTIAIDATHVYFTVIEQGAVMKVKKSGGAAIPVATELEAPKGIAVFNDRLLVVANGKILSLPKGD